LSFSKVALATETRCSADRRITIYTTAFAVAIALSHRLSVFFGNRKYLFACATVYAIASIGCAVSPDLPWFLAFRAIQGFVGGIFLVRTFVFFTQRIEAEHRASIALTFFIEVMIFGRLVPYIASGWVADNVSWRLQFAIPAILMLAAALLFLKFTANYWRQADNTGERVDFLGIGPEIQPDDAGFLRLTDRGINEDFAQDLSDRERLVLQATQIPASVNALGAPVTIPAWKTKPAWFIVASSDRAIPPQAEAAMAARMNATVTTVASSHVVMLSHPDEVSKVIVKAAHTKIAQ
jgi:MFS family permease